MHFWVSLGRRIKLHDDLCAPIQVDAAQAEGRSTLKAPALLPQVQATLGALWDAFEDIAVYMEVLKVQTAVEASPRGECPLQRMRVGCCRMPTGSAAGGLCARSNGQLARLLHAGSAFMALLHTLFPPHLSTRLAMLRYAHSCCSSACTAASDVRRCRSALLWSALRVCNEPALQYLLSHEQTAPVVYER